MSKKQYSNLDVEKLLQETARQDRRPMDDAMADRLLTVIREVPVRQACTGLYKRVAQWAAALVLLGVCLALLVENPGEDGGLVEAPTAQGHYATPVAGEYADAGAAVPAAVAVAETSAEEEYAPAAGDTPRMIAGQASPKRAYLSQIDSTLEAGFSPEPCETYQGKPGHRYGVSVHGTYVYEFCTDTL